MPLTNPNIAASTKQFPARAAQQSSSRTGKYPLYVFLGLLTLSSLAYGAMRWMAPESSAEALVEASDKPVLTESACKLLEPTSLDSHSSAHEVIEVTGFSSALETLSADSHKPYLDGEPYDGEPVHGYVSVPQEKPNLGFRFDPVYTAPPVGEWDGTVLVPRDARRSSAHTVEVSLPRIEAHPLKDYRLRVFVRVRNERAEPLVAHVACEFRDVAGAHGLGAQFFPVTIPENDAVDVYFISATPNVTSYTVMVR